MSDCIEHFLTRHRKRMENVFLERHRKRIESAFDPGTLVFALHLQLARSIPPSGGSESKVSRIAPMAGAE